MFGLFKKGIPEMKFEMYLYPSSPCLVGFKALDFRREFGLREHDVVITREEGGRTFEVAEDFARENFHGQCRYKMAVPVDVLTPGELVDSQTPRDGKSRPDTVDLSPCITLSRAQELFHAGVAARKEAEERERRMWREIHATIDRLGQ